MILQALVDYYEELAKKELNHNGHSYDDKSDSAVLGRLRMKD